MAKLKKLKFLIYKFNHRSICGQIMNMYQKLIVELFFYYYYSIKQKIEQEH